MTELELTRKCKAWLNANFPGATHMSKSSLTQFVAEMIKQADKHCVHCRCSQCSRSESLLPNLPTIECSQCHQLKSNVRHITFGSGLVLPCCADCRA